MVHSIESRLKSLFVLVLMAGILVVANVAEAAERGKPAPVVVIPDDDAADAESSPRKEAPAKEATTKDAPSKEASDEESPKKESPQSWKIRMGTTRDLPVEADSPQPPSELPPESAEAASELPMTRGESGENPSSSDIREAAFTEPLRTKMPTKEPRFRSGPQNDSAESAPTGNMSLRLSESRSAVVPRTVEEPKEESKERFEPASFNGVVAGVTKESTLFEKWDKPLKSDKNGGVTTHQFKVDPFKAVEAVVEKGVVISLVIHLENAFPANVVTQQLELTDVRPVLVANELGDVLGQSFPERGVLFAFEPSLKKGQPSLKVRQIVLEPIGPEPFLLRAETHKQTHFARTLADLDVVLEMQPDLARAHWIRAGLLSKIGRRADALKSARRAVELENTNPRYRLRCAEAIWKAGNPTDALLECQAAVDLAKATPHVRAATLLLMGDIYAAAPLSNFKKAIQFHLKAIEIAEPAVESRHPAIRLASKEVLVDAHLAAAVDVASGNWQNKDVAVAKWLASAGSRNEDLIGEGGRPEERRLHLAARALKACAGARDVLDPAPWGKSLMENAIALTKESDDVLYGLWVRRQAARGMCDCLRVSHWREETEQALSSGEASWEWLHREFNRPEATDADRLILGRMCFMTGSIQAIVNESHENAVGWFEKTETLLNGNSALAQGPDRSWAADCYVSMGVSYWQTGNKEKAVEVTQRGAAMLETLVREGEAEASRLSVPYANLAAMHGDLGNKEQADLFAHKTKTVEKPQTEVASPPSKRVMR